MTISFQNATFASSSSPSSSLVVNSSSSSLLVSNTLVNSTSVEEYRKKLFHKKMACAAANIADFIKRLYRMLEDKSYGHIVSWGITGDTFVVHDPTEFAKSVLPQHFKHNNMASFVRQLNKYDFHKIKSNDDDSRLYNEQAWEFQHPKFQLNRKDLLEDIKRKIPTPRKNTKSSLKSDKHNIIINNDESDDGTTTSSITSSIHLTTIPDNISNDIHSTFSSQYDLHSQVDNLSELYADLTGHVNTLSRNCSTILEEIITFKRSLAAQDALVTNLCQILAQHFNNNNMLQQQQQQQQRNNDNNNDNNNTTTTTTTTTSPINSSNSTTNHDYHNSSTSFISSMPENLMLDTLIQSSTSTTTTPTDNNNNTSTNLSPDETSSILPLVFSNPYTVTSQQSTLNLNEFTGPNPDNRLLFRGGGGGVGGRSSISWSIQPKVLFVDNELSNSTKWFQAYGCQFDVVADGINAMNKLHIQPQYDIIFMEINGFDELLNLIQQIRRFNPAIPIIGMPSQSSNSNDQSTKTDYLNYLRSGINDLLPKPFKKQELYVKIEKYCSHLKVTNVLVSSQNDTDNSNTIQQQQALNSISSNTSAQDSINNYLPTSHHSHHIPNLYQQQQQTRIHQLNDVDDLDNENSRKKKKYV